MLGPSFFEGRPDNPETAADARARRSLHFSFVFFFSSCQRRCTVHRDTGDHRRVIPGMFNSQEVLVFLADAHPRGPDR